MTETRICRRADCASADSGSKDIDPASLTQLPAVETVVHCVGFDRSAGKPMRAVYVDGLRNVLSRLPTPRRFLHVSSTSVYGQTDGSVVKEASPTEPSSPTR